MCLLRRIVVRKLNVYACSLQFGWISRRMSDVTVDTVDVSSELFGMQERASG